MQTAARLTVDIPTLERIKDSEHSLTFQPMVSSTDFKYLGLILDQSRASRRDPFSELRKEIQLYAKVQ